MTRRTTLFLVCAFEIALLLFVAAWSAFADTENSNSWFIEGRYQASVYEGTGWSSSEYDTPGTESSQIQSPTFLPSVQHLLVWRRSWLENGILA
jgi:hypothetical protein